MIPITTRRDGLAPLPPVTRRVDMLPSAEVASLVLAAIRGGHTIGRACRHYGVESWWYREWCREHPEHGRSAQAAMMDAAEELMAQTLEIADNCTETMAGAAKARIQVEARQMVARALDPARWGAKPQAVEASEGWDSLVAKARQAEPPRVEGGGGG